MTRQKQGKLRKNNNDNKKYISVPKPLQINPNHTLKAVSNVSIYPNTYYLERLFANGKLSILNNLIILNRLSIDELKAVNKTYNKLPKSIHNKILYWLGEDIHNLEKKANIRA
jgi:hypothetical protein